MGFSRDELQIPLRMNDAEFPMQRLASDLDDLAEADSLYGAYLADAAAVRQAFEQEPRYEGAGS